LDGFLGTAEDIKMPFSQIIKNKYPDSSNKEAEEGRQGIELGQKNADLRKKLLYVPFFICPCLIVLAVL
jgi:hypothetical protein